MTEGTPVEAGNGAPTKQRVYRPGWALFSLISLVGVFLFEAWTNSTDFGTRPFDYNFAKAIGGGLGGGALVWLLGFLTAGVTFKSSSKSLTLVDFVERSVGPCLVIGALIFLIVVGRTPA